MAGAAAAAAAAPAEPALNAYEQEREDRIKRNREIMAALGLFDSDVALAAQMRAADASGGGGGASGKGGGGKRKRTAPAPDDAAPPPRRSARVAGEVSSFELDTSHKREAESVHEKEASAFVLRHARHQRRASVVGTASYKHTLMRVRTMSEAALARRLRVIERAKGRHAVIKMRLFARVLFLEGYELLADEATEALARLIELLGDVTDREDDEE